jgi:hypothetical protein
MGISTVDPQIFIYLSPIVMGLRDRKQRKENVQLRIFLVLKALSWDWHSSVKSEE